MIIRLKNNISFDKVHHQVFFAIGLSAPIFQQFGCDELWITGVNESGHHSNSDPMRQFHRLPDGTCQAFDGRTHNVTDNKHEMRRIIAALLGPSFDVILENEGEENEHLHTQYDPLRPGTVI